MPAAIDKLVVANRSAMQNKYGAAGLASIQAALQALIVADAARGFNADILYIDDASQMGRCNGTAVVSAGDERGAKAAVDAAFNALAPDYILLLDGPDVVPHITLDPIAGLNDGDADIPSDLPYASSAGWSRQASNFLAVTRVVGRLPAAEGDRDPSHLVTLIEAAANHQPRPVDEFQQPCGISAAVWSVSTQLSLSTTFGAGTPVHLSPHERHPGIDPSLASLFHFINCHGAQADPQFYGEHASTFPVALESQLAAPCITSGAVAAAECCFGAELYNHSLIGIDPPICMSYLLNGAVAYVGSTNIAYGPAASNGQADLITQYFIQNLLTGSSSGAAMLLARQKFVQSQIMSSQTNLKTLAQFLLLGDPSLHPCSTSGVDSLLPSPETTETEAKGMASALAQRNVLAGGENRKMRRLAFSGIGQALAAAATKPGAKVEIGQAMRDRLSELAQSHNVKPDQVTLLSTDGGALYRRAAKAARETRQVGIVVDRSATADDRPGPSVRVLVAHILGDRVVRIEVSESR